MKRAPFLLIALTVVFACTDTVTEPEPDITFDPVVAFGIDPEPFFPAAINKMGAVENHLANIHPRLVFTLTHPPDPAHHQQAQRHAR